MGIDSLFGDVFWVVIKFGLLAFLFLYIIFAGVVIKQVSIMTQTVKMGFETFVKLVALIHFIAAIAVFIVALTSL
jgi:hypothetical protein